jgi:hypothetical protein
MVILPVLAGIFKNEIGMLFKSWNAYRNRPFDTDGDPETPETCEILNGATGEWVPVEILRYCWSPKATKRGVWIKYADGGVEKFKLVDWADMRKREPA